MTTTTTITPDTFAGMTADEISAAIQVAKDAFYTTLATERKAAREAAEAARREALANSPRARFMAATRDIRKAGVTWRTNVRSCCRGCVTGEQLGLVGDEDETTPYAWTFGGQGCATKWDHDGQPVTPNRWDARDTDELRVYINHGNGSARRVVDAFTARGFDVEWDGSNHQCVMVIVRPAKEVTP